MWLILRSASSLLVWRLLISSVASLSVDATNLVGRSNAERPGVRARSKSSEHEQVFLHKPTRTITKKTHRVVLQQQPVKLQPTRGLVMAEAFREAQALLLQKISAPGIQPSVPAGLSGPSVPSGLRASPSATAAPIGLRASASAAATAPRKDSTGGRRFTHQLPMQLQVGPADARLVALHRREQQSSAFEMVKTLVLVAFAIVLLGMFWVCFGKGPEDSDEFESPRKDSARDPAQMTEETPTFRTRSRSPRQAGRSLLDNTALTTPPRSPVFPAPSTPERNPQTREALFRLQGRPGSWVKTYQNSKGITKTALELLFRCNIIPEKDFADRYINQDQIDEYIWIGTQMLGVKSIEEWVENWPDAAMVFEESASACAAARQDAMQNLAGSGSSSPRIPRVILNPPRPRSPQSTRPSRGV